MYIVILTRFFSYQYVSEGELDHVEGVCLCRCVCGKQLYWPVYQSACLVFKDPS